MSQNIETEPAKTKSARISIPTDVLRDNRLSLGARGLFAVLAATPKEDAARQLSFLSEVQSWGHGKGFLQELVALGYITGECP